MHRSWSSVLNQGKRRRALRRSLPLQAGAPLGLLLVWLLAGCSTTKVLQAGDAQLRVTHRATTFDLLKAPDYVYVLQFPKVNLGERGEHVFHVRGLHMPMVPTELFLAYPVLHPRAAEAYRQSWDSARVQIELRDTQGHSLFSRTIDFATTQFSSDYARYTRPNFTCNLETQLSPGLRGLTNYDAVVTVLTPTQGRGDFARLRSQSYGYPEQHKPAQ